MVVTKDQPHSPGHGAAYLCSLVECEDHLAIQAPQGWSLVKKIEMLISRKLQLPSLLTRTFLVHLFTSNEGKNLNLSFLFQASSSVTRVKSCQMSIKVAQKGFH